MAIFEGAGVALITPFHANGEVNYEKLEELLEEQVSGGTDAVISCGTTGESSTMSHEEHMEVVKFTCQVVKNRIPVIAHCNNAQRAGQVKEELLKLAPFKKVIITETAGVATVYASDGGIILAL